MVWIFCEGPPGGGGGKCGWRMDQDTLVPFDSLTTHDIVAPALKITALVKGPPWSILFLLFSFSFSCNVKYQRVLNPLSELCTDCAVRTPIVTTTSSAPST